jgi:hypothetical protein
VLDKVEEVEDEIIQLYSEGLVEMGSCVRLECLPFSDWQRKLVPLVEERWIDRHFVELAEWCALLVGKGYERLPAWDAHPLAWERFFPPGTDWSAPREANLAQLLASLPSAREHLEGFPGRTCVIEGRAFLEIDDYLNWPQRKVTGKKGTIRPENGLVVSSWNSLVGTRLGKWTWLAGVAADVITDPGQGLRPANVYTIEDETDLKEALATRQELFQLLAPSFVPSELQQRIWNALEGKQLTGPQLENALGVDRKTLHNDWGLRGLLSARLVRNNDDRKGYYRPDKPPLLAHDP